jgi:hypothetical protein
VEAWQIALLGGLATVIATIFCIRSILKCLREDRIKKALDMELADYFSSESKEKQ